MLKSRFYCNVILPEYITFDKLLEEVDNYISSKHKNSYRDSTIKSKDLDDCNYTILGNKDGRLEWRPYEIMHPVLYLELVNIITEEWDFVTRRFDELDKKSPNITCCSPILVPTKNQNSEQILTWWERFEQNSIKLGLSYCSVISADISNCYGSIYTHSLAWALHGKSFSKNHRGKSSKACQSNNYLGNLIDAHIQSMRNGQTNGIPQGSMMMDLLAELLLAYIDVKIEESIYAQGIKDYKILRYRDDYRIFGDNESTCEPILEIISKTLSDFGMKLNTNKTQVSNDIISSAVKDDKLKSFFVTPNRIKLKTKGDPSSKKKVRCEWNLLYKYLLQIYEFSKLYHNSGSVVAMLRDFDHELRSSTYSRNENAEVLVSICMNILVDNPRTLTNIVSIVSYLVFGATKPIAKRNDLTRKIKGKLSRIQNSKLHSIWLQRIFYKSNTKFTYTETYITNKVANKDNGNSCWNNKWLNQSLSDIVENTDIVNRKILEKMDSVMSENETSLFQQYD
jgi:hypothetical protein